MEALQGMPWGIIAPIFIIQLILVIVALIDLTKIHQTNGPKWVWALVIIFINIVGPIAYFIAGRKQA
ncbi:PLD nuclease N-terminal domain-containing protein [Paenisporosarcina sp.]|uniref:PLD nuclease N-terminal domain-containing protein n=1 Tax=Paenisporosarcina sp. TaxID=1932001 RepID=UPI003C719FA2